MKKHFLFCFVIIFILFFMLSCDTECCESQKLIYYSITYKNIKKADNSANPKIFSQTDNVILQDLSLTDYTFCGWYDASQDGNKITGWQAGTQTKNVTLWARWTSNWHIDLSGDLCRSNTVFEKTSFVQVLYETTDITCDIEKGAFNPIRDKVTMQPYSICRYAVTQDLYLAVMGTNPSKFTEIKQPLDTSGIYSETNAMLRPVEKINWYHTIAFCNKLSLLLGKKPCYSIVGVTDWESLEYSEIPLEDTKTWNEVKCDWDADGYRLLTDCEWECAARGGKYSKSYPWTYKYANSNDYNDVAWCSENSNNHTWEVGLKMPNTLGIYDMSGNIWQWYWDFDKNVECIIQADTPVTGPELDYDEPCARLFRGGSFGRDHGSSKLHYHYYSNFVVTLRYYEMGFRIGYSVR